MPIIINDKKRGFFQSLLIYHLFLAVILLVILGFGGAFLFGFYAKNVPEIPDFSNLKQKASISTKIFGADGTVLAVISGESREWIQFDSIPPLLRNAFIAVEDARFYEHGALDYIGLARAMVTNAKAMTIKQGGSTITQQVAKYFMGGERTFDRKIKEVILALRMEKHLSKKQILELYLNLIFLGKNSYGVKAAALTYFNKNLNQLKLSEIAMLAGLAQAPSRYSPFRNMKVALIRREHVLERMLTNNFITRKEYEKSKDEALSLVKKKDFYHSRTPYFTEYIRQSLISKIGKIGFRKGGFQVETTVRPFVHYNARKNVMELAMWEDKRQGFRGPEKKLKSSEINKFIEKSKKYYGNKILSKDRLYLGVILETYKKYAVVSVAGKKGIIPLAQMRWAYRFIRTRGVTDRKITNIKRVLKKGFVVWVKVNRENSKELIFSLEQIPRVQSALYVMDHRTGYIIAMIGGTDFDLTKYNRTTQACRQPGSTYKPLYYSLALKRGWSIYKKFSDMPYSIVDPATGKRWRVTNYSYSHGLSQAAQEKIKNHKVTLESALVWSRNIPSVTIFQALGGRRVKKWVEKFGFTTKIIPDKGLALGASCVKIDELNSAFSVFAENGVLKNRITIRKIKNSKGEVIEDHTVVTDPLLTSKERLKRMIYFLGKDEKLAISPKVAFKMSKLLRKVVTNGHNDPIRKSGIIAAGKTGTASKTMDTWFVGYTSQWIATFWIGDEKYERPLGDNDAAHLTTAPSWGKFMYDTAKFYPLSKIPNLDPLSGETISKKKFYGYKSGKRPILHPPKKKLPFAH